jgi:hypothetical protein
VIREGDRRIGELGATQPLGRVGSITEIPAAAVHLVSDDAAWITGADLNRRRTPVTTWCKLDILVNCAGNFVRDTIADASAQPLRGSGAFTWTGCCRPATSQSCS